MPPILAAADEERLDADHPVLARQREDVGIAHTLRVDRLRPLHEGQRLQSVAQQRSQLEVHRLGRRLHLRAELRLHPRRLAGQEVAAIVDQLLVAVLVDPPDARRRTALDLVQQARPVARLEEAVGATAQQEQLLQRVQRVVDAARAGERAVVIARRPPRPAMLLDAREIVIAAQQDERKRLIVAQQHVIGGAIALDQLRLEQQRLGLVVGRDDRHRPRLRDHPLQPLGEALHLRVIRHALLQRARLADVQHVALGIVHAIDAGARRQRLQHVTDRGDPRLDIGGIRSADGVGGAFFVESIGRTVGRHARHVGVGRGRG